MSSHQIKYSINKSDANANTDADVEIDLSSTAVATEDDNGVVVKIKKSNAKNMNKLKKIEVTKAKKSKIKNKANESNNEKNFDQVSFFSSALKIMADIEVLLQTLRYHVFITLIFIYFIFEVFCTILSFLCIYFYC